MKIVGMFVGALLAMGGVNADPITWTFPPDVISTPGENAFDPQIVMDSSGNLVAIWVSNTVIQSSTKPADGSWSSVSSLSGVSASNPRLVIDSSGNATAVWLENQVVKTATLPQGGKWSASTTLSTSGAESPHLAVNAAGDVIAAWARGDKQPPTQIETMTKLFGKIWPGSPDVIPTTQAAAPRVAMGGAGANCEVILVWHGFDGVNTVVYAANQLIGTTWSSPAVISVASTNGSFADVAVDINGNGIAIWYSYDLNSGHYSNVVVHSSSLPFNSGSWSAAAAISTLVGVRDPADLMARVIFDANGTAVAAWTDSRDDSNFGIRSTIRQVNQNWVPTSDIVQGLYSYGFGLGVNSFGNAYIAVMFLDGTNSNLSILTTGSFVDGQLAQTWSDAQVISLGGINGFPAIATNLQSGTVNNLAALWVNYNGQNNVINAATGMSDIVQPPTNLHVTQIPKNFSIFTEYYNSLNWDDSTTDDIQFYNIYRNGLFLASIVPSVREYIDDNRKPNESVTYTIIALEDAGFQSLPVSISFP